MLVPAAADSVEAESVAARPKVVQELVGRDRSGHCSP